MSILFRDSFRTNTINNTYYRPCTDGSNTLYFPAKDSDLTRTFASTSGGLTLSCASGAGAEESFTLNNGAVSNSPLGVVPAAGFFWLNRLFFSGDFPDDQVCIELGGRSVTSLPRIRICPLTTTIQNSGIVMYLYSKEMQTVLAPIQSAEYLGYYTGPPGWAGLDVMVFLRDNVSGDVWNLEIWLRSKFYQNHNMQDWFCAGRFPITVPNPMYLSFYASYWTRAWVKSITVLESFAGVATGAEALFDPLKIGRHKLINRSVPVPDLPFYVPSRGLPAATVIDASGASYAFIQDGHAQEAMGESTLDMYKRTAATEAWAKTEVFGAKAVNGLNLIYTGENATARVEIGYEYIDSLYPRKKLWLRDGAADLDPITLGDCPLSGGSYPSLTLSELLTAVQAKAGWDTSTLHDDADGEVSAIALTPQTTAGVIGYYVQSSGRFYVPAGHGLVTGDVVDVSWTTTDTPLCRNYLTITLTAVATGDYFTAVDSGSTWGGADALPGSGTTLMKIRKSTATAACGVNAKSPTTAVLTYNEYAWNGMAAYDGGSTFLAMSARRTTEDTTDVSVRISTDLGANWGTETKIANLSDGFRVPFQGIYHGGQWKVMLYDGSNAGTLAYSSNGTTWTLMTDTIANGTEPCLAVLDDGTLVVTSRSTTFAYLSYATDVDDEWTTVNLDGGAGRSYVPSGGAPVICFCHLGYMWIVTSNESLTRTFLQIWRSDSVPTAATIATMTFSLHQKSPIVPAQERPGSGFGPQYPSVAVKGAQLDMTYAAWGGRFFKQFIDRYFFAQEAVEAGVLGRGGGVVMAGV